jgi:hypothetical protein
LAVNFLGIAARAGELLRDRRHFAHGLAQNLGLPLRNRLHALHRRLIGRRQRFDVLALRPYRRCMSKPGIFTSPSILLMSNLLMSNLLKSTLANGLKGLLAITYSPDSWGSKFIVQCNIGLSILHPAMTGVNQNFCNAAIYRDPGFYHRSRSRLLAAIS